MFLRYGELFIVILIIGGITIAYLYLTTTPKPVDFTSQVKPIINQKCITCHGGVKQKAGFSLLFREEALAKTESGKPAIIPGDADNSELIRRLTLNDPEERMPICMIRFQVKILILSGAGSMKAQNGVNTGLIFALPMKVGGLSSKPNET